MAMNNWGGVTEHMTKKPKSFLANRRRAREILIIDELSIGKQKRAEKQKQRTIAKEILLCVGISIVIFVLGLLKVCTAL